MTRTTTNRIINLHACQRTAKNQAGILFWAMVVSSILMSQLTDASEFIPLGSFPDANYSTAQAVSDDGNVVAGYAVPETYSYPRAFRWTDIGGMELLSSEEENTLAHSISGDGTTIVGMFGSSAASGDTFIWTEPDGMQLLGQTGSEALATSFDGSIVVGSIGPHRGYRWTKNDGLVELGDWYPEDVSADGDVVAGLDTERLVRWTAETGTVDTGVDGVSGVKGMSRDGSVIVGQRRTADDTEAFRWTEESGAIDLGRLDPKDKYPTAQGTNHDGSIIVGTFHRREGELLNQWSYVRGFVWTEPSGMKPIEQVLVEQHGLELNGYTLNAPLDISPNGRSIVGGGVNPNGDPEAWLVRLDSPLGTFVLSPLSDCNGDGVLTAADLACVTTLGARDDVLGALSSLPGDIDGDGEVAFADFLVLSENFGTDEPSYAAGNINLTGGVDFEDFLILAVNFGKTASDVAAVPEPSAFVLVCVGSIGIGLIRRRRRASVTTGRM